MESSPTSLTVADGQVALKGNSTTALARGNAADNPATFALGTPGGATPAMTEALGSI